MRDRPLQTKVPRAARPTQRYGMADLRTAVFLTVLSFAIPSTAAAQELCDCCGTDDTTLSAGCRGACESIVNEPLCRPLILPRGGSSDGRRNPLFGVDLKYLDLRGMSPRDLERVRRWAERWRARAERRFRRTLRLRRRGRISMSLYHEAEARRDGVVVNYQHVIRAYREAVAERRRTRH